MEAYNSIKLVECYYSPFYQIYNIIITKLLKIKPKLILQMFFKTFKNLAKSNSLVLTPLLFVAYFCIIDINILLFIIN